MRHEFLSKSDRTRSPDKHETLCYNCQGKGHIAKHCKASGGGAVSRERQMNDRGFGDRGSARETRRGYGNGGYGNGGYGNGSTNGYRGRQWVPNGTQNARYYGGGGGQPDSGPTRGQPQGFASAAGGQQDNRTNNQQRQTYQNQGFRQGAGSGSGNNQ